MSVFWISNGFYKRFSIFCKQNNRPNQFHKTEYQYYYLKREECNNGTANRANIKTVLVCFIAAAIHTWIIVSIHFNLQPKRGSESVPCHLNCQAQKFAFSFFSLAFRNNDLNFSSNTYQFIINYVADKDFNQKSFDH